MVVGLDSLPADFILRLQNKVSKEDFGKLHVYESGLVLIKKREGVFTPLGCSTCFSDVKGQTSEGNPTVNGRELINLYMSCTENQHNIPHQVLVNTWCCPDCKLVQVQYLPNFDSKGKL